MKKINMNVLSHEIGTPLNMIIGLSNLLKEQSKEKVNEYCEIIKNSAVYTLELINSYLLNEETNEIKNEPFSIIELLNSVKSIVATEIRKKNQEIIITNSLKNHNYIGDNTKVKEILINLLTNANKYTECFGKIEVSIYSKGIENNIENICIEVKDNGRGMSKELKNKMFLPYVRGEDVKEINGKGLGMSIVKEIVNSMGGKIDCKSQQNQGTTFKITLPLEINNVISKNEEKIISGLKFLVVEDNIINAFIIKELLSKEKAYCNIVNDGKMAFEEFVNNNQKYDVILLDMLMPKMNGYETCELIRKSGQEKAKSIPIIAMTADSFLKKEKIKEYGINDIIYKPIDIKGLKDVVLKNLNL